MQFRLQNNFGWGKLYFNIALTKNEEGKAYDAIFEYI